MPIADSGVSLPKQQTAVITLDLGRLIIEHNAPVPVLRPDMAIVRAAAVAINLTDAKRLKYSTAIGAIHGDDFAGTVVALGDEALKSGRLQVGDRVAGMVHGMNKLQPDVGAFAQYVGATADLLLKIPDRMSFAEAAGLGSDVITATMAVFLELRAPVTVGQLRTTERNTRENSEPGCFVLVVGGGTAAGTRAIQILKL